MVKLALISMATAPSFGDKVSADPMFLSFVRDLRAFEPRKANLFVRISYHFEQTGSWIVVGAYWWRMLLRVSVSLVLLVWLYLQVLVGKNLQLQRRQ